MKTLHLTLKKKWFDMILSGEKKEEYREIKYYWIKRLLWNFNDIDSDGIMELINDLRNPIRYRNYKELFNHFCCEPAHFSKVIFKNGYKSDAPEITIEFKRIEIKEGNPELGAEPNAKYFVISLGKIISTKNIKD